MEHVVKIRDTAGRHAVAIALDAGQVARSAGDFVTEVLGVDDGQAMPGATLAPGQEAALAALKALIFARDAQGLYVRDGLTFKANGRDLDPDAPMASCFESVGSDGETYQRCELVVGEALAVADGGDAPEGVAAFARMGLVHMLAVGRMLDVTRDHPDLTELLATVENEGLVEVDVARASYGLSPAGRRLHDGWIAEAQDLILRYDIYADVDLDARGKARFDTGLGQDLRVPVFELEGVDPFRARFLVGLNDGEWDQLADWPTLIQSPAWYDAMFAVVESAPSVEELGREVMRDVMADAKTVLRDDDALRRAR